MAFVPARWKAISGTFENVQVLMSMNSKLQVFYNSHINNKEIRKWEE